LEQLKFRKWVLTTHYSLLTAHRGRKLLEGFSFVLVQLGVISLTLVKRVSPVRGYQTYTLVNGVSLVGGHQTYPGAQGVPCKVSSDSPWCAGCPLLGVIRLTLVYRVSLVRGYQTYPGVQGVPC